MAPIASAAKNRADTMSGDALRGAGVTIGRVSRERVRRALRGSAASSGRPAYIVAKQAAKPRASAHIAMRRTDWLLLALPRRSDRPIPQPLMRPLRVVMLDILVHKVIEMLLAKRQEVIEALDLQRLDETFDEGVGVGRSEG